MSCETDFEDGYRIYLDPGHFIKKNEQYMYWKNRTESKEHYDDSHIDVRYCRAHSPDPKHCAALSFDEMLGGYRRCGVWHLRAQSLERQPAQVLQLPHSKAKKAISQYIIA